MVSFHGNIIYQMNEKVIIMLHHDIWLLRTFAATNSYDFFNLYCSNLLKNPTVRGVNTGESLITLAACELWRSISSLIL